MYDSGVKQINDYTFIYSGISRNNWTKNVHGVTIFLDSIVAKVCRDTASEWEAINERIIKIRMKCKTINMTVIAVYSPVNI